MGGIVFRPGSRVSLIHPSRPHPPPHWRAAGKPTVGFVASFFLLEGASLRKTLKTCGFSPQETSCWKMVGLPCSPAPTIFSRSAAQCRCTLTLVATLLYPELWRFRCKICPWCQITRGHSDTSSHVSIPGGRKDTTRRKNYGKLNARLPRRSPARQPLHGRWIQLEHCWTLRLPDMLEGLEHLAWGQTR